jgi:hypothetical protein
MQGEHECRERMNAGRECMQGENEYRERMNAGRE